MPFGFSKMLASVVGGGAAKREPTADHRIDPLVTQLKNIKDDNVAAAILGKMSGLVAEPYSEVSEEDAEDAAYAKDCRVCNRDALRDAGAIEAATNFLVQKNLKVAHKAATLLWGMCIDNEANIEAVKGGYALRELVNLFESPDTSLATAVNSALQACGVDGASQKQLYGLIKRADNEVAHKIWNAAIRTYSKALELEPDSWMAVVGRCRCYVEVEDWNQLDVDAQNLVTNLRPDAAVSHGLAARARLELKDFETAAEEIAQGEEIDPEDPDVVGVRYLYTAVAEGQGLIDSIQSARDASIATIKKAAAFAPKNKELQDVLYAADKRAATLLVDTVEAEQLGRSTFDVVQAVRAELLTAKTNFQFGTTVDQLGTELTDIFVKLDEYDDVCWKLSTADAQHQDGIAEERNALATKLAEPSSQLGEKLQPLLEKLYSRKQQINERMESLELVLKKFPDVAVSHLKYDKALMEKAIVHGPQKNLDEALGDFLPYFASPESFDGNGTVMGPKFLNALQDLQRASETHMVTYKDLMLGKLLREQVAEVQQVTRTRFDLEKTLEQILIDATKETRVFLTAVGQYLNWYMESAKAADAAILDLQLCLKERAESMGLLGSVKLTAIETKGRLDQSKKTKVKLSSALRRVKGDYEEALELQEIGEEVDPASIKALKQQVADAEAAVSAITMEMGELQSKMETLGSAMPELHKNDRKSGSKGMKHIRVARSLNRDYHHLRPQAGSHQVYIAEYLGKDVVLKGYKGKTNKAEFAKQLVMMTRLSHPTIIHVDCLFYDPKEEMTFAQMELCAGGNFRQWFLKQERTSSEIHCVLKQAAQGLAYLHERDIVHGDVKPEALLMYSDTELRIGDFEMHVEEPKDDPEPAPEPAPELDGVAPAEPEPTEAEPEEDFYEGEYRGGDSTGTAGYIAPEVSAKNGKPTTASDVWSFGAVLYEAYYKSRPNPAALVIPPETIHKNLSRVLETTLSNQPSERPSAMNVVLSPYFVTPPSQGVFDETFSLAERRQQIFYNFLHTMRQSQGWGTPLVLQVCRKNVGKYILENYQPDWVNRRTSVYFEHQFDDTTNEYLGREIQPRVGSQLAELYRLFFDQVLSVPGLWQIEPRTRFVHVSPTLEKHQDGYIAPEVRLPQLQAVGGMLAKCLLEGFVCHIKFAPPVFKYLLGQSARVNFSDLFTVDPMQARELTLLYSIPNDATDRGLTFDHFMEWEYEDMKPGQSVSVTDSTKHAYAMAVCQEQLIKSRVEGLEAFATGFTVISDMVCKYMVPQTVLNADDLGVALQGSPSVASRDVLHRLRFSGFAPTASLPKLIPEMLAKMSSAQLNTFLAFVTGSPAIPAGGLRNPNPDWPFPDKISIICDNKDTRALPAAHIQFYALVTPDYPDELSFLTALEEGLLEHENAKEDNDAGSIHGACNDETLQTQAERTLSYIASQIEDTETPPPSDPELPPPPAAQEIVAIGLRATALFDYMSPEPGDLQFYAGQIISLQSNNGAWWTGFLEDDPDMTTGQFPSNYVEVVDDNAAQDGEAEAEAEAEPEGPTVIVPEIPGFSSKIVLAAIYDFPPGEPGDLDFMAGDKICVTDQPEGGWWKGYVQGNPSKVGQFPANYLEDPNVPGGASNEGAMATCTFDFDAQQEGDLHMGTGDSIVVLDQSGGDWWTGYAANDPQQAVGQFPASYVQLEN